MLEPDTGVNASTGGTLPAQPHAASLRQLCMHRNCKAHSLFPRLWLDSGSVSCTGDLEAAPACKEIYGCACAGTTGAPCGSCRTRWQRPRSEPKMPRPTLQPLALRSRKPTRCALLQGSSAASQCQPCSHRSRLWCLLEGGGVPACVHAFCETPLLLRPLQFTVIVWAAAGHHSLMQI